MPFFCAAVVSAATSPGPPPWLSMVRPPQNLNLPSTLKAWAPDGCKPHALGPHPAQRLAALSDEHFAQLRIGAVLGDAIHVIEELIFGIRTKVRLGDLLLGEVRH